MTDRTRRRLLLAAGGAAIVAVPPGQCAVAQTPAAEGLARMRAAVRRIAGEAPINEGRVRLDLPPLVENGNAVPLTVSVESPMTAADHVRAIHIVNERNPQPDIVAFRLGPRAGRARVSTRVRLADTQTVTAIAQMSDGSFWSGRASIVVTLAACLEEL